MPAKFGHISATIEGGAIPDGGQVTAIVDDAVFDGFDDVGVLLPVLTHVLGCCASSRGTTWKMPELKTDKV